MIAIILLIIGIVVMFAERISVSSLLELRRPRTFIFGGALILFSLLAQALTSRIDTSGGVPISWAIYNAMPLVLSVILLLFLKQPKESNPITGSTKSSSDRIVNVITWVIVGTIGLGVLYWGFNILVQK